MDNMVIYLKADSVKMAVIISGSIIPNAPMALPGAFEIPKIHPGMSAASKTVKPISTQNKMLRKFVTAFRNFCFSCFPFCFGAFRPPGRGVIFAFLFLKPLPAPGCGYTRTTLVKRERNSSSSISMKITS